MINKNIYSNDGPFHYVFIYNIFIRHYNIRVSIEKKLIKETASEIRWCNKIYYDIFYHFHSEKKICNDNVFYKCMQHDDTFPFYMKREKFDEKLHF